MKPEYINHQYFNSYYYANIVNNLIINRWNFLGFVSQFFEIEPIASLIEPWQKKSVLHQFIYYVISTTIEDEAYDDAVEQLKIAKLRGNNELGSVYIEWVFENYQIECYSFKDFCPKDLHSIEEDDFYEYYIELILCSDIEGLYKKITEEVFYIIFNNRNLLLNFNWIVAGYIQDLNIDMFKEDFQENSVYLLKEGQLKRESIPEWVKHAVYFRDRGKCCLCKKDLSGTLSLSNEKEYDHIVPLSLGGSNDVTNIQLLCKECNRNKGDGKIFTSNLYEKWY
ncbi:MAG: HNH endonuclease [Bacteroidia bacterium]|nr:HNH endonuclease [Bacteroidia bacterium]